MSYCGNLGYIYIISNDDNSENHIKIGSTFSYEKRYYQYKTYSSLEWKYIKVYEIISIKNNIEYEDQYDDANINCYNIDNIIQKTYSSYLTKNLYKECKNGGHEWYCNKDNLVNKIDLFIKDAFEVIDIEKDKLKFQNFTIYRKWITVNKCVLENYINKFRMEESENKVIRSTRDYQKTYISKCFELLMSSSLCLLVAPTGSGKTFMFYTIARKILRKKRKERNDKEAIVNIVILSP